jgi:hypothetical protein
MASFRGIHGAMPSVESHLQRALPATWLPGRGTFNARMALLGGREPAPPLAGNVLGLYAE